MAPGQSFSLNQRPRTTWGANLRSKVLLLNQTWVHLLACSEANLLPLGYGEGKRST